MSTLRVDNFGPSAGGTTYSARGIAKAQGLVDMQSSNTLSQTQNMSSFTDDGSGLGTWSYTNPFTSSPNTSGTSADTAGSKTDGFLSAGQNGSNGPLGLSSTSNFPFTLTSSSAIQSDQKSSVIMHGDLA